MWIVVDPGTDHMCYVPAARNTVVTPRVDAGDVAYGAKDVHPSRLRVHSLRGCTVNELGASEPNTLELRIRKGNYALLFTCQGEADKKWWMTYLKDQASAAAAVARRRVALLSFATFV